MPRLNKFRPGRTLRTFSEVARALDKGQWIYWWHKPQHPEVMLHMQAKSLWAAAQKGILKLAVENQGRDK